MLEIVDCDQNSPEWLRARLGLPTASEFATILAKGRDGGTSLTRKAYLYRLAGEIVTGEPCAAFAGNHHTERGHEMEPKARDLYAYMHDAEPELVGFVRNGQKGCSPDSFIGANGILEIKSKQPDRLLDCMFRDDFPPDHKAQCQGALWVCEREWIDLACFWPRLPLVVHRAYRDEAYIKKLSEVVDAFNEELQCVVDRIRAYGGAKLAWEAA